MTAFEGVYREDWACEGTTHKIKAGGGRENRQFGFQQQGVVLNCLSKAAKAANAANAAKAAKASIIEKQ